MTKRKLSVGDRVRGNASLAFLKDREGTVHRVTPREGRRFGPYYYITWDDDATPDARGWLASRFDRL